MRIIVDADACPSIDLITNLAKNLKIELLLYTDNTHNIKNDYAQIIILDKGFQSVDIAISNDILKNDILITQDYGLALIGISKRALVVHPKGMIYSNDNIEQLLFEKHLNSKMRKQNKHIKGPKKRTKEDDIKLIESITYLIKNNI